MALDNSRSVVDSPAAAAHVDVADPQVVDGAAVLGQVGGDVAPLEELHGRNGLVVPGFGGTRHLVSQTEQKEEDLGKLSLEHGKFANNSTRKTGQICIGADTDVCPPTFARFRACRPFGTILK